VTIVDDSEVIKIKIGEEKTAPQELQGGMLQHFEGVSSSEVEEEDSKCTMCSRNKEVVGICTVCALGMCEDCWDPVSGMETTSFKCTRCWQETDKVQEATSVQSSGEEEEKEESETASQQGDQWRKRLRLRPGATAPSPVTAPACMLCDDDTHIPRPCLGCPVVMCMERWEQQSGLTEVLCTRCFQETDKEGLRRMAEAGDENAEQLLRKKEEKEEKDKKEGAAAAEDAEQEHSD
jgi:hypothetical protein